MATTPMVVLTGRNLGGGAPAASAAAVSMSCAAVRRVPRARDQPARFRVPHVAHRVHGDESAHRDVAELGRRAAKTTLHRAGGTPELADGRSGARADIAFGHASRARRRGGGVAHGAIGSPPVIAHSEVVEDGAGHVRHHGLARRESRTALFQPVHDAPNSFEAKGAAAREHDGIDRGHEMARIEELEPVNADSPAADLDAGDRRAVGQHDRDPGEPDLIGGVTDPHAQESRAGRPHRSAADVGQLGAAEGDLGGHIEPAEHEGANERNVTGRPPLLGERRRGNYRDLLRLVAARGAEDQRHLGEALRPAPARFVREEAIDDARPRSPLPAPP